MEIESLDTWDGYRDWRNRPALRGRHGGMLAASFVLAVEVLENLAFLANASNLVMYMTKKMRFSPSGAANAVTAFMGTAFLLALLGGFLADAFFTTFHIYLISATIEFLGLVVLTTQAFMHSAEEWARGVMFGGLYLVALGVGGIKGSLPPHGAEQFDEGTTRGRKERSYFFNYFIFSLSCGALIAVTFVVWVEDNRGWHWGFGVSTLSILLSLPLFLFGSSFYRLKVPMGSPITTLFKVLIAALYAKLCRPKNPRNAVMAMETSSSSRETEDDDNNGAEPVSDLGFFDKATTDQTSLPRALQCTKQQAQDVKIVLKILPIFMSTIMLNCCLAQLSTFSVQQASTMNTKLGDLTVPPAALPVFPVVFTMILAPLYNHVLVPLARRATRTEMGITHLQRIGTGLLLSVVAMAVAALVETKRKRVAVSCGLSNPSDRPLPITFLWLAFQYVFLGSADLFTLAGMMEFFFTEAPSRMRSLATSLSWTSLAMGYYLSSVLVSAVNFITGSFRHAPWLSGENLNQYHLERFYWLMCLLSGVNFVNYLFWACRYTYRANQN